MDQIDVDDGREETAEGGESELPPMGAPPGPRDYGPGFMERLRAGWRQPGPHAHEAGLSAPDEADPPVPSFVDYGDHLRGLVQGSRPAGARSPEPTAPGPVRRRISKKTSPRSLARAASDVNEPASGASAEGSRSATPPSRRQRDEPASGSDSRWHSPVRSADGEKSPKVTRLTDDPLGSAEAASGARDGLPPEVSAPFELES